MDVSYAEDYYDPSLPVGNEYRFFGGRILVGPDIKSLLSSTFLIFAPAGVFLGLVAPYLGRNVSWALVAITCVLVLLSAAALCMTAFRDPGFIPKSEDVADYGMRIPTKDYLINGYTVTTKWCPTCCHYRPPRCFHCAVCDCCVDKFDHHCPWVGTCIGRRNYRYFMLFIFSTTALCCWVFALSLVALIEASNDRGGDFSRAISAYPAALVLMVYTFLAFWFVGGLSAFHIYLSSSNQTTCEHVRRRFTDNPYSTTLRRNCAEVFCTRIPPRHTPLLAKQMQEMAEAGTGLTAVQQQHQAAPPQGGQAAYPYASQSYLQYQGGGYYGDGNVTNGGNGVDALQGQYTQVSLAAGPAAAAAAEGVEQRGLGGDAGHLGGDVGAASARGLGQPTTMGPPGGEASAVGQAGLRIQQYQYTSSEYESASEAGSSRRGRSVRGWAGSALGRGEQEEERGGICQAPGYQEEQVVGERSREASASASPERGGGLQGDGEDDFRSQLQSPGPPRRGLVVGGSNGRSGRGVSDGTEPLRSTEGSGAGAAAGDDARASGSGLNADGDAIAVSTGEGGEVGTAAAGGGASSVGVQKQGEGAGDRAGEEGSQQAPGAPSSGRIRWRDRRGTARQGGPLAAGSDASGAGSRGGGRSSPLRGQGSKGDPDIPVAALGLQSPRPSMDRPRP